MDKSNLKFNLTNAEVAARRKVTRMQILQGDAECFMSKNPILLSGELAYERDTGKIKIGDGLKPWKQLPYKIDQTLDEDMADTIMQAKEFFLRKGEPGTCATLGADGKISRDQLPADLRATTVVRTIADMDKIPQTDKYTGLFVFVLDASEDDTVGSGGATYIWTDKWEKVSEAESMEVDQSDFLLKSKDTLDDILAGIENSHFTKEDKAKLDSIEKNATGDLSAQEIATMYESIQNVNRLTDDLKAKLESVEAGATADTPEKIKEKLHSLTSAGRLDADHIKNGVTNRFFTDNERKELDDILLKLKTVDEGATKDTPEQLRDKLQSLTINKAISADYINNGSTHKFLSPAQLESVKLIGTISEEINTLKIQLGDIASDTGAGVVCDEKIKVLTDQLTSFKTEINNIITQKISTVQVDVGSNKVSLEGLRDAIARIQRQLSNINESWVKSISDKKINKLVGDLDSFKTEINTTINQKISKFETDLGNNSVSLVNLGDTITRIQNQLGNINEAWIKNIFDTKIQETIGGLESFKTEINTALNQRINKVEIDLGNNTLNLNNLGDTITRIHNQLGNINEAWVGNITDRKIQAVVGNLTSFKTEINKTVTNKLSQFEVDLGDLSLNLRNEFVTNINEKIEKVQVNFQPQIDKLRAMFTPDQIKVLYESNPDTNVFTDVEKTKLAGIMPNADVTSPESVREAGAVMEGDVLFGGDCATMF